MAMKSAARTNQPTPIRTLPDTYFELVRRFPLTHVWNDADLEGALRVIDQLLMDDLDEGGQEYLDALTDLVETYESEHVAIPDASEADVLRELMAANLLTQSKLAKGVGIAQSTLSAVMSGKRTLTAEHMIKLAAFFHVPPAVFLPS